LIILSVGHKEVLPSRSSKNRGGFMEFHPLTVDEASAPNPELATMVHSGIFFTVFGSSNRNTRRIRSNSDPTPKAFDRC
jgi:hypothetical protein